MEISFLAAELFFSVIWLIVRIIICVKQKSVDWKRESLLLLMFVNLAVIIRYAFFPRDLIDGHVQPLVFEAEKMLPLRVNLRPFVHLLDYDNARDIVWNVAGNSVMYIPTGVILPVLYKKLDTFWKVIAVGAILSLCIEILQLPFASRASDVDDLILNTFGVAVGYGIYGIIKRVRRD